MTPPLILLAVASCFDLPLDNGIETTCFFTNLPGLSGLEGCRLTQSCYCDAPQDRPLYPKVPRRFLTITHQ